VLKREANKRGEDRYLFLFSDLVVIAQVCVMVCVMVCVCVCVCDGVCDGL
jgi:hypothetical protein